LDLLANPYAPAPEVREQLAISHDIFPAFERLEAILAARIARHHRVNPDSVLIGNGLDSLLETLTRRLASVDVAYRMSPDDLSGAQLRLHDAVSLARQSAYLIIDERHAAYAPRDYLPLHREFDNVLIARTLETWGGLTEAPVSYVIASASVIASLRGCGFPESVQAGALMAGIASFEHVRYLQAAARKIAQERVELIRALRKLNMVRPCPSSANFVLARLERGNRDDLRAFLDAQGIIVHYPNQPGFEDSIRVSAISRCATSALTTALVKWARDL
jgi:histidinol-phosphate aminotransferase